MGRWLILLGLLFVIAGLILHFFPGLIHWFGRLPGDVRIESGRTRVYIPVTSMILISIILTLLVNIIRRIF